ncbi:(deoxy)nucleoside triphosphate pyrophosphohydrolase [Modestobacter sp. VKM Ac-2977]|uniref:(deoxy)nucleoside triphosphate pyrophosphohydrolase n=1 Tax=Modestobacter sp. VKM Ac-2977 TaxID=3004131 RepID=UPI0022AAB361|nr:(deoxy)nucleoside triphosphate pyrophosphohydrolase [Modestobacter sp. VKM Ac-2977]MCZ2819262.1 (deoxy)nucleoside triphosphate pyrophosphohydrolase [Modestobacter sp. VKM Ac-2977]
MFQLRFTTLVEAPLTVAFDVARSLGRPWPHPLQEVVSERPWRDVHVAALGSGWRTLVHTRSFTATAAGTLVEEQVDAEAALPGWLDGLVPRRRVERAMQVHLDAYAAAAARRAQEVTQVVGAALVDDRQRVLVAQRGSGPLAGLWEFPGGKVEPGEPEVSALVRECREELGVGITPGAFLGEVPLDGVVAGGVPGASTLRLWSGLVTAGELVAHEHSELRWLGPEELEDLDWIPADRPLLPAVRALLVRR